MNKFQPSIDTLMGNIQLGVGAKCGVEKIVHLANHWISSNQGDVVLVDFSNAFNTVSRTKALLNVKTFLPDLFPYVESIYGQTPDLWLTMDRVLISISSAEGAQQGDPLGPLLFVIATLPLFQELQSILLSGHLRAYIDDLSQLAPFEQQIGAIQHLISSAPSYGLTLNFKKFHILMASCPSDSEAQARRNTYVSLCPGVMFSNIILHPNNGLTNPTEYGLTLLG
jgi:hypothetical protein